MHKARVDRKANGNPGDTMPKLRRGASRGAASQQISPPPSSQLLNSSSPTVRRHHTGGSTSARRGVRRMIKDDEHEDEPNWEVSRPIAALVTSGMGANIVRSMNQMVRYKAPATRRHRNAKLSLQNTAHRAKSSLRPANSHMRIASR
jgi:hypothetical protein